MLWLEREVDGKEVVVGRMVVLARRRMRRNDVIYWEVGYLQPLPDLTHGSPTPDHPFRLLSRNEHGFMYLVLLELVLRRHM